MARPRTSTIAKPARNFIVILVTPARWPHAIAAQTLAEHPSDRQQSKAVENQEKQPQLILASGSPRRRMLLNQAGLKFSIIESRIPERRRPEENAREFATRMARAKALAVSRRVGDALVLGADTIVECRDEILGKPKNEAEAARMLKLLSERTHTVVTAFAIARGGEILEAHAIQSRVTFRRLADHEIAAYIASGEPFDKAGGYGIQERGAEFIAGVEGARDNVMGLPVRDVIDALHRQGFSC
ncbi:MAG: Maf family protein [Candidatus Binataceae bacterium]